MDISAGEEVAFVTALMRCAVREENGSQSDLEFRLTIGLFKSAISGQSRTSIIHPCWLRLSLTFKGGSVRCPNCQHPRLWAI